MLTSIYLRYIQYPISSLWEINKGYWIDFQPVILRPASTGMWSQVLSLPGYLNGIPGRSRKF